MYPFNSAYTHLVIPSSTGSKVFFMCSCERCVQMREYLPGYSVCRSTWKIPIMTIQVIHFYSQLGFLGYRAASSLFECPRLTMTSAGWKWSVQIYGFFFISGGEIAFPCSVRFAKVHALPAPYGKDCRQIFWPVVSRLGLNKQFVPLLHKHRKTILHSNS